MSQGRSRGKASKGVVEFRPISKSVSFVVVEVKS